MDLGFVLYVLASCVLLAGGTFRYVRSGAPITAGIFFIGVLIIIVYYGIKWYTTAGTSTKTPQGGSWPPVLNTCPDFLSVYNMNGTNVCIDTIGIAGAGGISQWTDPVQTDAKFQFNLNLDKKGADRVAALCKECKSKNVTWEGVWDGAACMNGAEPPIPMGS